MGMFPASLSIIRVARKKMQEANTLAYFARMNKKSFLTLTPRHSRTSAMFWKKLDQRRGSNCCQVNIGRIEQKPAQRC